MVHLFTLVSNMLYRILRLLIGIGIRLYYREIRVTNRERLTLDGPTIIIANHPNTMLDAWIITMLSKRPIYYMAKGTFFSSSIKRWFLKSLGLVPVNRYEDSHTKGISNQKAFEHFYQLLESGDTLLIFPEGNSTLERQLRELRSGSARIALEAEARNNGKLGLKIIPIGLVYVQGEKFRGSVLAKVGEIIDPMEYYSKYRESPSATGKELTEVFRQRLDELLVHSASKDQEGFVDDIIEVLDGELEIDGKKGVEGKVDSIKMIHSRLNKIYSDHPQVFADIEKLVYKIKWQLNTMDIDSKFLSAKLKKNGVILEGIGIILTFIFGLPIFIFGLIHNVFPFKLTSLLMSKIVKEPEYYAPIAILLGIVLYPLTYAIFLIAGSTFFGLTWWMLLLYFMLLPFTGMFAFYYLKFLGQVSFKWRFLFLLKGKKSLLDRLRSDKRELKSLILDK
ncbi:MAG: 1-acyl-sn-glycerol-3-phosphate acyltransferase [Flavobacteriaceae bacterium]|jgi:1-acyl-sn-glycerol-3-phosphate acyltransferase